MDRRRCLKALSGIALGSALAGCSASGQTDTLATRVSDQPGAIGDFDTLLNRIDDIVVEPAEAERKHLEADAEVDLTELVGEASALIDETELDAGAHEFLQLDAEATEATLSGGGSATVTLPVDTPLKFEQPFEIRSGQTTTFVADFTPVNQGGTDRYVLQPVADAVEVIYGTATEA